MKMANFKLVSVLKSGWFAVYRSAFKVILDDYKNFIVGFVCVSVLFVVISMITSCIPLLLKGATNAFGDPLTSLDKFYLFAGGYAVCWTLAEVLANVKGVFSAWILAKCSATFNGAMIRRILRYPYSRQANLDPGVVYADINRAASSFGAITVSVFWTILPIFIEVAVALVVLGGAVGLQFSLLFLVSFFCLFLISIYIAALSKNLHSSMFAAQNEVSSYTVERLSMMYDVRLNNAYDKEDQLAAVVLDNYVATIRRANINMGIRLGFQALAIGIVLAVFTLFSIHADESRKLTAGDFAMIAGYIGMLTTQLRFISGALIDLQRSFVALDVGMKYLSGLVQPALQSFEKFSEEGGVFELKDVAVGYLRDCSKNISFSFRVERMTAISGRSGVGKSTLLNVLLGLQEVSSGTVCFKGRKVSQALSEFILTQVSVVPQKAQIISGTLRQNLCYGADREIPDDELQEVIGRLSLTCEGRLEDGSILNYVIGPQGAGLSGGERQRISIGRALLRDKSILILDEPTSALDAVVARDVIHYIRSKVPTLIVVTHDRSIVALADDVLYL